MVAYELTPCKKVSIGAFIMHIKQFPEAPKIEEIVWGGHPKPNRLVMFGCKSKVLSNLKM